MRKACGLWVVSEEDNTMAKFDTKSLRNIALLGHGGSGKTSLAEAMIYITGGSDRLGRVSDGNTVCDYDAEEIKQGFGIKFSHGVVLFAHDLWAASLSY